MQVTDDVVLTDLAYEKAKRLGLQLVNCEDAPPAAPVRPYLSEMKVHLPKPNLPPLPSGDREAPRRGGKGEGKRELLEKRIREKVAAQLGSQIDPQLLDAILKRTLKVMGMK